MNSKRAMNRILSLMVCMLFLMSGAVSPITAFATSGSSGNIVLGKAGADVTATTYDGANIPQNAVDGSMSTRWGITGETGSLTVNLGNSTTCTNAIISDYNNTVTAFTIEYYNGTAWSYAYKGGTTIGLNKLVAFNVAITCTQIRLNITTNAGGGISEFEVYNGTATKATVTVGAKLSRKSTKYVGFSASNFSSTSNATGWMKYSNANTIRTWLSPGNYIFDEDFSNDPTNIITVSDFDKRKVMLRTNPDSNININWASIDETLETINGKNTLRVHKLLGIKDLTSISCNQRGAATWQGLWDVWRKSYVAAFYFAKNYDINVFQSANEPEAWIPEQTSILDYVKNIQVQSDAVRCAVADVNRIYDKNLVATYVGPVLASNPEYEMPVTIMKANNTDYHGNPIDYNIYDWFDKHRYSGSYDAYTLLLDQINNLLIANTPKHQTLPITMSEWNWHTSGDWNSAANSIYTSDSAKVFSIIGTTLATTMSAGVHGMYLFKMWTNKYEAGNYVAYTWGRDRDETTNIAKGKPTVTSSSQVGYEGAKAVDGDIRDNSVWMTPSNAIGPQTLEINLIDTYPIQFACIDVGKIGGDGTDSIPQNISLQYFDGSGWINLISQTVTATEIGTNYLSVQLNTPISTNKIRCLSTDSGTIRVREIVVSQSIPTEYVGGPMKSYEVNRMFATGFKDGRDLFNTTTSDSSIDVATSYDPVSNNYYMWFAQPNNVNNLYTTINLSGLDVYQNTAVSVREVSPKSFGEIPYVVPIDENKSVKLNIPEQSAILVTIPKGLATNLKTKALECVEETMVSIGANANTNYSSNEYLTVRQSTSVPSDNKLTYLKFNTGSIPTSNINRAVLELRGRKLSTAPTTPFTIYAYGLDNDNWTATSLTGNNAPNLNKNCAFLTDGGKTAWPVGVLSFMGATDYSRIDITDYVKNHPNTIITIALERDKRIEWEVDDTNYVQINSSKDADVSSRPKLKLWYIGMPFSLSNLTYIPNAGTGNIGVDIANNTTNDQTVQVIYGVYKANKLVGIKISQQSLLANETKSLLYPVPVQQGTTWDTIKTFVFDTDFSTLKPIALNTIFFK